MSLETFVVTFQSGYWRIDYEGQWFGTYPDRASAQKAFIVDISPFQASMAESIRTPA